MAKYHLPSAFTQRVRQLESFVILSQKLSLVSDLDPLLQAIADGARELLGASMSGLVATSPDTPDRLAYFKVSGASHPDRLPAGHGLFMVPVKTGKPVRVDRVLPTTPLKPPDHPVLGAFLAAPLRGLHGILGSLFVANHPHEPRFTLQQQKLLLAFAHHAAMAIDGAQARERKWARQLLEERDRIGSALHASVAQTLFILKQELERQQRQWADYPDLTTRLGTMHTWVEQSLKDLRAALVTLSEAPPENRQISRLLAELTDEVREQWGIQTQLIVHGPEVNLAPDLCIAIYRCVQESLQNVVKHSRSSWVLVSLIFQHAQLTVVIQDAGIGFAPESFDRTGYGLRAMTRWIQKQGGHLSIGPNDEGGITVRMTVPTRPTP